MRSSVAFFVVRYGKTVETVGVGGDFGRISVHPKNYAHGARFAVFCTGLVQAAFSDLHHITSLAKSYVCPIVGEAALKNMGR